MKRTCPVCGATASEEAWQTDAWARQFDGILPTLHPAVMQSASHYLGLFRRGSRGLAWRRAVKLIRELRELTQAGTVQWDGGEVRPAPPQLWADVMEYMVDHGLRELDNHNYLVKVVWERARGLAAQAERVRDEAARHGMREPERVSEEERVSVKGMLEEFRKNPQGFLKKQRGT